jgi:PTS system fructose-specific IIA component/PTS system nitrogen regulatory IIA component
MKFHEFIESRAIRVELEAASKEEVLSQLVDALVAAKRIGGNERENIIAALMKRERLGSTGIGRGVAVPHAKHASVERLVGTVAVSKKGVEFESIDGDKAYLFFLLISPTDRPSDNLRALESISRQLSDESFCRFLKQSKSAQEVQKLLQEADSNQFG